MHKKISLKKLAITGVAASTIISGVMPAMTAMAAPPVYKSNVVDEIIISKIIPAEDYMEITYNKLGTRDSSESPTLFNIQYGEVTDYQLHYLGMEAYAGSTVVARGHYDAQFHWESIKDGSVKPIMRGSQMGMDVRLVNNTSNKMHFVVIYGTEQQRSRIDYSRCVESTAYKSGAGPVCKAEIKDNGLIQYQPYTFDGKRVEITDEEDAALTAATESWQAEPGNWGDEWYSDSERPSTDDSDDGDDTSGDGGSDGGDGDRGSDDSSSTDADSESSSGSDESGNGSSSDSDSSSSSSDSSESGNSSSSGSESSDTTIYVTIASTESSRQSETSSGGTGSSVYGDGFFTGLVGSVNGGTTGDSESTTSGDNTNSDNNAGDSSSEANNTESEVGVPGLGKEEESGVNWAAAAAIVGMAAAGLVGWWFLFFGRYKFNNKRKENKKSRLV